MRKNPTSFDNIRFLKIVIIIIIIIIIINNDLRTSAISKLIRLTCVIMRNPGIGLVYNY